MHTLIGGQPLFGVEDPTVLYDDKDNWYHRKLTYEAAASVGFTAAAADAVSWHAYAVDSYNYNPLSLARVGLRRLRAVLATRPHLDTLHFDDLTSAVQVAEVWDRILSGTVAGLLWAAESGRVDAAHNLLGASCHAVQDFYSHSNWIDEPGRRGRTYLALTPTGRYDVPLYTGTYRLADDQGIKAHGKIVLGCGVARGRLGRGLQWVVCHNASPLAKTRLCEWWLTGEGARSARPRVLTWLVRQRGIQLPSNLLFLTDGIALDSTWQAVPAVEVRNIDLGPRDAFETALDLARTATVQWLQIVEHFLHAQAGERGSEFWRGLSTGGGTSMVRRRQFEDTAQLPYTFLTAAVHPPAHEQGKWFARLDITTSTDVGSSTSAPIHAEAVGVDFLLNRSPRRSILFACDDFRRGETTSHVIGPLGACPQELTLRNRAPATGLAGSPSPTATDWKCERVRCFVFHRGDTVACGTVLDHSVQAWVRAEESIVLPLNVSGLARVEVRAPRADCVGLYGWWHGLRTDHWTSSDAARGGLGPLGARLEGYLCIRQECLLLRPHSHPPSGTVPVHTWWNPKRQDHLTTADQHWSGMPGHERDGYRYERLEGLLFDPAAPQPEGTVAVYHWWSIEQEDNWLTSDPGWAGDQGVERDGYRCTGIAGYGVDPLPEHLVNAWPH